jgi:chromate transporter
VLNSYKDRPWVQGMANAVVPVVAVMLGVLTWDFVKKSSNGLGWAITSIIIVGSLVLMEVLGLHPALLILGLLGYALLSKEKKPEKEVKAS